MTQTSRFASNLRTDPIFQATGISLHPYSQTIQPDDISEPSNVSVDTQAAAHLITNDFIGTPLPATKPDNVFRIFFNNPNGFTVLPNGGNYAEHLEEMKRFSVDLFGHSEINLDTTNHTAKKILYDTTRNIFNHYRLVVSSSPIPTKSHFKPGGTLQVVTEHSCGRVIDSGTDLLGRWCYQILAGKNQKNITVITAYQCCEQRLVENDRIRTLTAHAQQVSTLRQHGRSSNPRPAFIHDLRAFLQSQQDLQHGILLMGDFNDPLGTLHAGMTSICSDFCLTDLMLQLVGRDNFATWERGRDRRVDYVLCSDWIAAAAIAGCYEPFRYRTRGDHRNITIDFHTVELFGNPTHSLATMATREFSSKDPRAIRKYIETKHAHLTSHSFAQRMQRQTTNFCPRRAEGLDRDFQRSSVHAAKQCKRKPNLPYVKHIATLRQKKNILLRVISQPRTGMNYDLAIQRLISQGTDFLIPNTIAECNSLCREIHRELRSLEKSASTHRRDEQLKLLREAQATGDKIATKFLRNKLVAENTKEMFRKLKNIRGTQQSGFMKIEVPRNPHDTNYKQCRDWISIDVPTEIEEKLRIRNQRHFGQAHGTFPTIPPFSEWVDWSASTHVSDLILEGQWSPAEITPLQQDLINYMKRRTSLDSVTDVISITEWTEKIKTWPESTSTSPSGFHLTHSKALLARHDLEPDTDAFRLLESKRDELITWQVQLMNQAIQNQYVYDRWKTIANVMILKEPGNYKIHRLRVIHLYEHDYNLLLAVKWRSLIRLSTAQDLLNPGQFGAVPGRDAIMPTLIEELQYEITRASKRPLVHVDYDATACYDRIIMSLASLSARSYGQHRNLVLINASMLKSAKYLLKTMLGMSSTAYHHNDLFPIYGSGQGAGNSPGLWCCISSTLFDVYEDKAHGAYFQSPCGKITTKVYMIGFVDDTSGSTNDFLKPILQPMKQYVRLASKDAQRWNDTLALSGGALEDTKCSYHFMKYDFAANGLPVLKGGRFKPQLKIRVTANSPRTPLSQLSAYTPHKTLGTFKSPVGSSQTAFQKLYAKSENHSKIIMRSPLDRTDSWTYYHAIYLPSICYPLPSCTIADNDCLRVQRQIKQALLPKYGFNRNSPNAVVYGHSDYAGIGLRTFSVEQGIAQIESLIKCLRSSGLPQKLSEIAISWAQLLAGTGTSIFEDVATPLPQLEPMKWLPSIRLHLHSMGSHLWLENTYVIPLQRVNDCFLMDAVIQSGLFTSHEIKLFNACRLYLGVTLLSDICSSSGTHIQNSQLRGIRSENDQPRHLFPYQSSPDSKTWRIWRRGISLHTHPASLLLQTPLRQWLVTGDLTSRQWQSYIDPFSEDVYIRDHQDTYHQYSTNHQGILQPEFTYLPVLPLNVVPVEIDSTISAGRILPYTLPYPKPAVHPPSSFSSFIRQLDDWEFQLLRNIKLNFDPFLLMTQWQELSTTTSPPCLSICSDGSAPDFTGTFGWSCSFSTGTRVATNSGPAPGYRCSSFRSEAHGLLSALRFLLRLSEYTAIPLPPTSLHSDSLSCITVLDKMAEWPSYYPNATLCPEWDVLQAIVTSKRALRVVSLAHVKGHQDRTPSAIPLSLAALLNIEADHLADTYQYPIDLLPQYSLHFAGNPVCLQTPHGTITSRLRPSIRRIATATTTKAYLRDRNKWTTQQFNFVDWDSHGITVRKSYNRKNFVIKLVHDWLPLGKRRHQYDSSTPQKCPSCPHQVEDQFHFFSCQSRTWQTDFFADLTTTLATHKTRPALSALLHQALQFTLCNTPMTTIEFDAIYQPLITRQHSVGWHQLLMGRFVTEWQFLQDAYLSTIPSSNRKRLSGQRWVTTIITLIWHHLHINWLSRNNDLHGVDAISREQALIAIAQQETASLYTLRHQVLPRDRQLFYSTVAIHFEKETTSRGLRQWISTWKPVILQSVKDSARLNTSRTRSIRSYFSQAISRLQTSPPLLPSTM